MAELEKEDLCIRCRHLVDIQEGLKTCDLSLHKDYDIVTNCEGYQVKLNKSTLAIDIQEGIQENMKKMEMYDIVEVDWIDAQCGFENCTVEELIELAPCLTKSSGYLVYKDDEKVILCFMLFNACVKHYQIIPARLVKKITIMKKRK